MIHVFICEFFTENMRLTCGPGRPIPAAPASPCRGESARVSLKLVDKKHCGVQRRETNKNPTLLPLGPTGPSTPGNPGFPCNTRLDVSLNCSTETQINTGANVQFSLSLSHSFLVSPRSQAPDLLFRLWVLARRHRRPPQQPGAGSLCSRHPWDKKTKTISTNKTSSVGAMHCVPGNGDG